MIVITKKWQEKGNSELTATRYCNSMLTNLMSTVGDTIVFIGPDLSDNLYCIISLIYKNLCKLFHEIISAFFLTTSSKDKALLYLQLLMAGIEITLFILTRDIDQTHNSVNSIDRASLISIRIGQIL